MDVKITNDPVTQRFEAKVSGHSAHLDYVLGSGILRLVHTKVPEELAGQGVGSKIVQFALDFAKDEGLKVIPQCPFVSSYIERHSQFKELLQDKEAISKSA